MDDAETFTETERLLLMAAAVHGLGPSTDLSRANTARVVNQALLWLGLSAEEIRRGWEQLETHDQREQRENHPSNEAVYEALIRMTHQLHRVDPGRAPVRVGLALFEGGGNWGVPGDPSHPACLPHFNSCRLTAHGQRIAQKLLARHPGYRKAANEVLAALD